MITKDSDYLNNKLRQLKTSVLNKGPQYEIGEVSRVSNYPASQKYVPTYDEKNVLYSNYKPPGKVTFQGPTDSNLFQYNAGASAGPQGVDRNLDQGFKMKGSASPNLGYEAKRPNSTQIIETLKYSDGGFNGVRGYPGLTTNNVTATTHGANANPSVIINPMEPRVKTVHAQNSRSFVQPDDVFGIKQSQFQIQPPTLGTEYSFRGQPTAAFGSQGGSGIPANLRTTTMTHTQAFYPERTVMADMADPQIFQNLNITGISEKNENKMINEMQQKLAAQIDKNGRLGEEIMAQRRLLESERGRLMQLDQQLREEYKHAKISEAETANAAISHENKLAELTAKIHEDDDRYGKMRADLEKIQVENEMLRGELKRLGEITSEKILDLENNINSVARMKDFENENFAMEKDKVGNSADFVIEQMKVHFNERSGKIEDQMRQIQMDKDKLGSDLKGITDELRQYNFNADQRINSIMNAVIQEEQDKHQTEMKDIEGKVRLEEEEIARLNRRTQDLINKLQTTEREGKNRLMAKKNENTRLKEDLSNFEQNYNKLLIQVSNENREYEKRKEMVDLLKEDFEEVHNKSQMLDQRYEEEMHNIQAGHEESLQDLERDYAGLREKEQRLQQMIREENERIYALQKKHSDLIDQVQRSFNDTLHNQFPANK